MKRKTFYRRDAETQRFFGNFLRASLFLWLFVSAVFAQEISVKNKFQKGNFPLVDKKRTAGIFISRNDCKVVEIAANDLAKDVELVSSVKPNVVFSDENLSKNIVIIGTLGGNPLIEKLIADKKLDVSKLAGTRETFQIETIVNPFPNVENALFIVGSDRRGTAFGVYEMSQKIGVSPWVWWADVAPEKRESLIISKTKFVSNKPSVKYRGIFLNDEDWGLNPWAAKTMEAEHFTSKIDKNNFVWSVIFGLGKTGDSVSISPNTARTFADLKPDSPALEYRLQVSDSAEFEAKFFLIPTQPLIPGNGLRFAFAINDDAPQIIAVDKDTEVSSSKWTNNILNETTVGVAKIKIEKGAQFVFWNRGFVRLQKRPFLHLSGALATRFADGAYTAAMELGGARRANHARSRLHFGRRSRTFFER